MIELNKIYHESNLETLTRMANRSIDYCLTSPPYNVNAAPGGRSDKYEDFDDALSKEEYFDREKNLISELLRVTKNHIFYNIQLLSGNKWALNKLQGHFADNIKELIIWNKGFGQPAISEKVFNSAYEHIIIFSNNEPNKRYFSDANFARGTQSNLHRIKNKHHNDYSDVHKAVMPLDIPRYFMQNFGNEFDIWYDPYSGTGTTAIAALMENRKFLGSEISTKYFNIGNKRIGNKESAPTLF